MGNNIFTPFNKVMLRSDEIYVVIDKHVININDSSDIMLVSDFNSNGTHKTTYGLDVFAYMDTENNPKIWNVINDVHPYTMVAKND